MRFGRLYVAVVALGVVAASCSGGSDSADSSTTSSSTTIAAPSSSTSSTTTTQADTTTTTHVDSSIPATSTIVVVQGDLTILGYLDGVIDGIAGEITQAAIAAFQTDAGIEADGQYGPITDGEMAKALAADEGYVTELQEFLVEEELYGGPIDGDYGKGTTRAVEKFQESCDLEPTGSLDIATRLCLAGL
jgi:peptidoglycan hydrolase-like protein with peptidoglycan-binding domain